MAKFEARFEGEPDRRRRYYDDRFAQRADYRSDFRDTYRAPEDVGRDVGRGLQDAWLSSRDVVDSCLRLMSDVLVGLGSVLAPGAESRYNARQRTREWDDQTDRFGDDRYGRAPYDDDAGGSPARQAQSAPDEPPSPPERKSR